MQQVLLTLTPQQAADNQQIEKAVARELHLPSSDIALWRIQKRSVDARQRDIKVLLTIQAFLHGEPTLPSYQQPQFHDVHNAPAVTIVGAGPAGLFAALTLLEHGLKPVILERGKQVSDRKVDIACLNKNEGLNPESNYCFGEGGAGTFSDGKLFSRSKKRGNMQRVLELFHYFGANDSVLYETHAHIGSDKLPAIIRNMRECIIAHGGEFRFSHTWHPESLHNQSPIILAIGHSAHDTYRALDEAGVQLQPKGFALGVRCEHPQSLIDDLMYHRSPLRQQGLLPAANYALVTQVRDSYGQRGVYSFCMCPGGHIVPAGSERESGIVNGMSASHRNSPFANSGMVVELHPSDEMSAIDWLTYQENIEHLSWEHGAKAAGQPDSAIAPAQRMLDFVEGRRSADLPKSSYLPGCRSSRLDLWLPGVIAKGLQQGFRDFDRKYPGFLTNQAVILGVESRSSSPVRIPRNPDTYQACDKNGQPLPLYPCGEGAGYAGGITSSALDGINAALALLKNI